MRIHGSQSRLFLLFITLITLLVANLLPQITNKLQGEFELGMLFMYIFFAAVGAGTDATQFLGSAFILFVYGMTIILVEQNLRFALKNADYVHIINKGVIVHSCIPSELEADPETKQRYLGV